MRRLFWKIFGWFWGTMVLIGLALYFFVLTTRPDPLPSAWRETIGSILSAQAVSAVAAYERGGSGVLSGALLTARQNQEGRFWLFDEQGKELSGLPVLSGFMNQGDAALEAEPGSEPGREPNRGPQGSPQRGSRPGGPGRPGRGAPPEPPPSTFGNFFGGDDQNLPTADLLNNMVRRALQHEDTMFELAGPEVMVAQEAPGPQGRKYIIAGFLPRPHFGRPAADPHMQLLGGVATMILSGLFCYGLVRYITAPLISLRDATRLLAQGDLSARTGAESLRRRDEVADLGRDFDTMATRLENLVNAERQLLGDISHELRSPLSRLSMALALARRHASEGKSGEEIGTALERIGRETHRLNELIGQLLELTRLESGDTGIPQTVDLDELVSEVAADADFEAQTHQKAVRVTDTLPCITVGSRELLHSALENVVRNAARFTQPGTEVEVSLGQEALEAVVKVRDYGPGVPETALTRLFEPFYRVEAARDRGSGGVGLGLAITERAIRSHGGTVIARNAEGGGLEIEMRLPVD